MINHSPGFLWSDFREHELILCRTREVINTRCRGLSQRLRPVTCVENVDEKCVIRLVPICQEPIFRISVTQTYPYDSSIISYWLKFIYFLFCRSQLLPSWLSNNFSLSLLFLWNHVKFQPFLYFMFGNVVFEGDSSDSFPSSVDICSCYDKRKSHVDNNIAMLHLSARDGQATDALP